MSKGMERRKLDYPRPACIGMRWLFGLFGWKAAGDAPNLPKFVVVGAPHTSNWDGVVMFGISMILGVRMIWLGKHTLFKPPLGRLMHSSGGIPINREASKNAVEQVVQVFNEHERLALVIAPEGTRKKAPHWKSGFYYMALGAGVPLVLGYVDYPRKRAGLGLVIYPSGDIEADFVQIRAFYADKVGRYPEQMGEVAPPP